MESRLQRVTRIRPQVAKDLQRMVESFTKPTYSDFQYLKHQAGKYLKPLNNDDDRWELRNALEELRKGFASQNLMRFDTGLSYQGKRSVSLAIAFMHAPLGGGAGDIRVNNKAAVLSDAQFAGTLVHEATHMILKTVDVKYAITSARLKDLPPDDRFRNADNWRLFYQKMRSHFRKEPFDAGGFDIG